MNPAQHLNGPCYESGIPCYYMGSTSALYACGQCDGHKNWSLDKNYEWSDEKQQWIKVLK